MAPEIKYTKLFIDNEWVDSQSGKTFDTYSPHDGSVIASVAEGDKADVDLAVSAAKRAFKRNSEWRLLDASQRGQILIKFGELITRDSQYLAELESLNCGMVMGMAKRIMEGCQGHIQYIASLADKIQGSTIPVDGDMFTYTLKQPVGVCALILPWNVPVRMFINKVVTALTAGCTVVVKPAEQTPLTALYLAALLVEAGLPKGVINIINGYGETAGVALTHHPDVAKISFTGSAEVGKLIQQAAGVNNLKRVTLELGGKSPLVIMDDADLNTAVFYAGLGVFTHQGQICIAASRLFVHSNIYDKFIEAAIQYAKRIKVGDPSNPTTQQGPQIDGTMMEKVFGYIEKGKQEGAKLVTGGNRIGDTGFYIEPTIFVDVKDDMTIAKEEIFGPVQSILKFDTLDEVIDRANATNYGLASGIFTTNINNALHFAKHVEAGTVGKLIQQAAGVNNLKRVTLELGGKSPLVIMDDADLNTAVFYAGLGVFTHQGQICIAASRLFVHSNIYDKFIEAAIQYAKRIKVGDPSNPTTQQGPQIDGTMMEKVFGYIEKGKQEGAKLVTGGNRIGDTGFYIEPTIFVDVKDDMTIAKEEIFGPVQSILKFDTLDEVIDRANATNYGLASGIFTTNINNALHFAKHVEAGTVWVNQYLGSSVQCPFGGFKESGLGRENGLDCVDAYLEVKTVAISLPKKI